MWKSYFERVENYFKTDKINDSLKKDVFLACRKMFTLLCSLTAPGAKEYDKLVTLLTRHMAPKPLIIVVQFQNGDESINEYAAGLQR